MLLALLAGFVSASATALALSPLCAGRALVWGAIIGAHAGLAGLAGWRMREDGSLSERLTPRGGDFTIGVLAATALLIGSWMMRARLVPPGSVAAGWIARIYLVIGDPNAVQRSVGLTLAVLAAAGLVELTWRGLIQTLLEERLGARWGWLATAGLFTLASTPSLVLLADTAAGLNPLFMVATGACGLTWGFLTRAMGRLWPAIFSHMTFLYFTAVQFRVPGITPPGL